MAHHSSHDDPSMSRAMRELFEEQQGDRPRLGPTDQFPQGKLSDHDDGEIRMAVGTKDGRVVIDFGNPVVWVGMTPTEARSLASLLLKHAANALVIRVDPK